MSNPLIQDRDRFSADFREHRMVLNGRDWGVIDSGSGAAVLVLIPGTLGRADVFWTRFALWQIGCALLQLAILTAGG